MKFKIFSILILINLSVTLVLAQSNRVSMTVTPSSYPDTFNKPAVVVEAGQPKTMAPETNVQYETATVTPETKLSVGKASATTVQDRQKSLPSAGENKTVVNYSEQKVEQNEAPANEAIITPK